MAELRPKLWVITTGATSDHTVTEKSLVIFCLVQSNSAVNVNFSPVYTIIG
jgi:hypothetical protein